MRLAAQGFKSYKTMGQCFLTDANIPDKIVRMAALGDSDGVLEAGPGFGALTLALSRVVNRVTAVELDERLLPSLREILSGVTNVDVIKGDILKLDIAKLVNENMPGLTHHVCANLPYNITTPLLALFINAGVFKTITVMIQKEVAERICAKPGSSEYGAFTVFVNYYSEPQILFTVPPECFTPQPGVHSAVVTMKTRKERILQPEDEPLFFRVVRAAFAQRRKTLCNALYAAFGDTYKKEEIASIIGEAGFDAAVRGERLGVEEFAGLSLTIKKSGKTH